MVIRLTVDLGAGAAFLQVGQGRHPGAATHADLLHVAKDVAILARDLWMQICGSMLINNDLG